MLSGKLSGKLRNKRLLRLIACSRITATRPISIRLFGNLPRSHLGSAHGDEAIRHRVGRPAKTDRTTARAAPHSYRRFRVPQQSPHCRNNVNGPKHSPGSFPWIERRTPYFSRESRQHPCGSQVTVAGADRRFGTAAAPRSPACPGLCPRLARTQSLVTQNRPLRLICRICLRFSGRRPEGLRD